MAEYTPTGGDLALLRQLAAGRTRAQAAAWLGVIERSAMGRVNKLKRATGLVGQTDAALVEYAVRKGWLPGADILCPDHGAPLLDPGRLDAFVRLLGLPDAVAAHACQVELAVGPPEVVQRAALPGEPACGAQAYCGLDEEAECDLPAGHAGEWHEETRHYPAHDRSGGLDEVAIRWRRA